MTSHSTFRPLSALLKLKFVAGVIVFCTSTTLSLRAQLIPIGPFSGVVIENYEAFPAGFNSSPLLIMGGAATITSATAAVTIPQPFAYSFGLGSSSDNAPGNSVQPADGLHLLGIEDSTRPTTINLVFTNTVKAFGGYWGAGTPNSNSPVTITFAFFDAADQPIGAPQSVSYIRLSGDGQLEWHGWFSSTAFKRVEITSSANTLVADSFRAGASGFSVFTSITPLSPTQIVLKGNGTTGVVYNVQATTNLASTNWTTLGSVTPDATGALQFTNTSAIPQRFYRLQVP